MIRGAQVHGSNRGVATPTPRPSIEDETFTGRRGRRQANLGAPRTLRGGDGGLLP